eukprot:gene8001-1427_t
MVARRRRQGLPRAAWTEDPVLRSCRFCCIDRRDDYVTRELLVEWEKWPAWGIFEKVLLSASLRFTSSRRGAASTLAAPIASNTCGYKASTKRGKAIWSPMSEALAGHEGGSVACGAGTYQMTLSRAELSTRLEPCARQLAEHVAQVGPFPSLPSATEFIALRMRNNRFGRYLAQLTFGGALLPGLLSIAIQRSLPRFSSAETAKDLAYLPGVLATGAGTAGCIMGPGARKGLALCRAWGAGTLPAKDGPAMETLLGHLWQHGCHQKQAGPLKWMHLIDVEQALCEFAKYERYLTCSVGKGARFQPAQQTTMEMAIRYTTDLESVAGKYYALVRSWSGPHGGRQVVYGDAALALLAGGPDHGYCNPRAWQSCYSFVYFVLMGCWLARLYALL